MGVAPQTGVSPGETPVATDARHSRTHRRVAFLGNPNTGKTTLFNRFTGLRQKTSNFPGTTLEARIGRLSAPPSAGADVTDLIDLPGLYSLELDALEAQVCRDVLAGRAAPSGQVIAEPSALCVVADATNLARNLLIVGEALRRRLPTVVALNMTDLARRQGLHIDAARLESARVVPVIAVSARTGEGLAELQMAISGGAAPIGNHTPPGTPAGLRQWADDLYAD